MRLKYVLIITVQVILLIGIIAYREYWSATGNKVLLKTAPVDPRDIFRGDYVNLSYKISSLDLDALSAGRNFSHNQKVFVSLEKDENGICRASSVGTAEPQGGLFIQGRVLDSFAATRYKVTFAPDDGDIMKLEPRWLSVKAGERAWFCIGPRNNVIVASAESAKYKPSCNRGRPLSGRVIEVRQIKFRQLNVEYGIESYFVEEDKGRDIEKMRNDKDITVEVALRRDGKGIITGLFVDGRKIIRQ